MIVFEVHFKDFPEPRPYFRHGIDLRRKYTYLLELDVGPTGLWIDVQVPEMNRKTGQALIGQAKLAVPWDDIEYVLAFDDGIEEPHEPHHPIGFIHSDEQEKARDGAPPPHSAQGGQPVGTQELGPITPID